MNGFITTTLIGATGVGSVTLHFDRELETNSKEDEHKGPMDKNYLDYTELQGLVKLGDDHSKINDTERLNMDKQPQENLGDGIDNLFSQKSAASEIVKSLGYDSYLKVNEVTDNKISHKYGLSSRGLVMDKGQELGHFNMGSSIMLVFEAPKGSEFAVKEGQEIELGTHLFKSS